MLYLCRLLNAKNKNKKYIMKENNYCVIMAGGVGSRFGHLVAMKNRNNF